MSLYHVLYNPLSGSGSKEEKTEGLQSFRFDKPLKFYDITGVDYHALASEIQPEDGIILCGGDGTLNRFINDTADIGFSNEILYYACGSGNDFCRDVEKMTGECPFPINKYLENLPLVTVKGKTYRFLDNVGFGIDGYCTLVGDKMRAQGKKNINYAGIAIKGMLGGFHPVSAKVTVDGVTEEYKNVWLAPTMKGRYYGGGMMPTPAQRREDADGKVSLMVFHKRSKLKTLMVFPSIFQGEHVRHKDMIAIRAGHEIEVVFDRPCPLQIDGETIPDVTTYRVSAKVPAASEA